MGLLPASSCLCDQTRSTQTAYAIKTDESGRQQQGVATISRCHVGDFQQPSADRKKTQKHSHHFWCGADLMKRYIRPIYMSVNRQFVFPVLCSLLSFLLCPGLHICRECFEFFKSSPVQCHRGLRQTATMICFMRVSEMNTCCQKSFPASKPTFDQVTARHYSSFAGSCHLWRATAVPGSALITWRCLQQVGIESNPLVVHWWMATCPPRRLLQRESAGVLQYNEAQQLQGDNLSHK